MAGIWYRGITPKKSLYQNFRHTTILFSSNEPKFPEKIRNWDFLVVCSFPSCMYIVHLHIVSHMCISYFFQILLRTLFDTGQSFFKSTKIHRQIMKSKIPGNVHIYTLRPKSLQSFAKLCAAFKEELRWQIKTQSLMYWPTAGSKWVYPRNLFLGVL